MRRRRIVVVIVACSSGLLAWGFWASRPAIQVEVVGIKAAEVIDDTGTEMSLVTLSMTNRLGSETLFLGHDGAKVDARVAGAWIEVRETFLPSQLGANESKEASFFVPGGADRCRIRLQYALVSVAWRLGGSLSRLGIKLPPRYWQWAGWPKAEGRNPSWKELRIEFPLVRRRASSGW